MAFAALLAPLFADIGITGAAATIGSGIIEGAGLGALEGAVTGEGPLKGAEFGALSGGLSSGIGVLDPALPKALDVGLGTTVGGLAMGDKPVQALEGGAEAGILSSVIGGGSKGGAATTGGGATSAAGAAVPASLSLTGGGNVVAPSADLGSLSTDTLNLGGSDVGGPNIGGSSLPGTGAGGAGLPGSVGAGAASGAPSVAGGGLTLSSDTLAGNVPGLAPGGASPDSGGPPITVTAQNPATDISLTGAGAPTLGTSTSPVTQPAGAKKVGLLSSPTALLGGVGLLGNLLGGDSLPPEAKALEKQASSDASQSAQLEGYIQSGTLPQGLQAQIDQASNAAIATIKSQYASRGMSGSSAEAQDISAVGERASGEGAQLALQLYQSGVQESQISSQIYGQLLQVQEQQDQQQSAAVANFAGALAGISRPVAATAAGVTA